jgi:hypothetical protein
MVPADPADHSGTQKAWRRDSEFDGRFSCTSFAKSGQIRSWEDVQQFRKLYDEMKNNEVSKG